VTRDANLSRNSGVAGYEIAGLSIQAAFKDGTLYVYDHQRPGAARVETMKSLADAGLGLNTFINQFVNDDYAKRLR